MALEDGAMLGHCFGKIEGRLAAGKKLALRIYEDPRGQRTESIVARGNQQQGLYHLPDGDQQQARDDRLRMFDDMEDRIRSGECNRSTLPAKFAKGSDPLAWRRHGGESWLLRFDCQANVDAQWSKNLTRSRTSDSHCNL